MLRNADDRVYHRERGSAVGRDRILVGCSATVGASRDASSREREGSSWLHVIIATLNFITILSNRLRLVL